MSKDEKNIFLIILSSFIISIILSIVLCISTPSIYKSSVFQKVTEKDYKLLLSYATTIAENYDKNAVDDENIIYKNIIDSDNAIIVVVKTHKAEVIVTFYREIIIEEIDGVKKQIQTIHYNNPINIEKKEVIPQDAGFIIFAIFLNTIFLSMIITFISFAIDSHKKNKETEIISKCIN